MTAPKAEITGGRKITAVWIIPLAALVLGIWMVVYTFMTEGPTIEVHFKTAAGLEEGKTLVKYRDVEIGTLQKVTLNPDLEGVTARIKMRREAVPLLHDDTRFWVVTARIGGGNVTGLNTLISGAYIAMSPGTSGKTARVFEGLERAPLTAAGTAGLRLVLFSDQTLSVSAGDVVLYNGYPVGHVEDVSFDTRRRRVQYVVFVDAPYNQLVDSSVRFWDVSGIRINAGADGFKLETGTLETLLRGGVAFGRPPGVVAGDPVENDTEFKLYASWSQVTEVAYDHRLYYVVSFAQSLKGLEPGAPVEYRGIRIGSVERVLFKTMLDKVFAGKATASGGPIPVLIALEPGRVGLPDTTSALQAVQKIVDDGVEIGLRASLVSGNLLTGGKIVELDYHDNVEAAGLGQFEGFTTIPTVPGGLGRLENQVATLLDKVNRLPLEQTLDSLDETLAETDRSMRALRALLEQDSLRQIPDELRDSLLVLRDLLERDSTQQVPEELEKALAAARMQLQGDSPETYQLGVTLKEVEAAARSLREFLNYLQRNPEALIRGKSETSP
ncbi:MAG: MlaD family protein [Gammaproteobacteria bacterium]|jgi:paraquat-inducible protein B